MGYKMESIINRWKSKIKKQKQDEVLKEFFETDLEKK